MLPLLADLTLALDPARLFRRVVGGVPDPWQTRVLRSEARQIILNNARQSGKSTSTAALTLRTALYHAPALNSGRLSDPQAEPGSVQEDCRRLPLCARCAGRR